MQTRATPPVAGEDGNARPARGWKNAAAAALPVLACFLGGATEKWAEGVIIGLLGILLLFNPPRFSLGWILNLIFAGVIGCAAFSFLPERLALVPAWRTALTNDFGVRLAGMITPQPWITFGAFVSLVAGLCWLYYTATQELELRSVRWQLRFFAAGIIFLAAFCILLNLLHISPEFWHNQRSFGPFPNRNQTANVLGLTAILILACGQDSIRRSTKGWIFWLLGFGIIVTAIVLNFSRAGVLILVIGSVLWIAGLLLRKVSAERIAIGVSILLVLLAAMFLFGGQTIDRFHLRAGVIDDSAVSSDFRWLIYLDAMQLIRASPWCGIGLGNFEPVFAIFRNASLGNTRALHPESDWIWLWSEAGWLAVVLVLLGFGLLLWRVFPLQEGTNQRFRRAALIGAVLFAIHGLIDVSGHRVGTVFSAIFLLGLSLFRPLTFQRRAWIPWAFRLLGIALLAAGGSWIWMTHSASLLPGGIGAENAKRAATLANRSRSFDDAIRLCSSGIEWAPLDWQLYFLRADAEVASRQPVDRALADFRRARFLEPNSYEVPLEEGKTWIESQPLLAVTAWREALRRAGPQQTSVYSYLLSIAPLSNPEVDRGFRSLAAEKPDLLLIYFGRLSAENVKAALTEVLAHNPDLNGFTAAEKTRFLNVWAERGDREAFATAVAAHADWLPLAWRAIANYDATRRDFRAAMDLTRRFHDPPVLPEITDHRSSDELQRLVYSGTNNYAAGFALYSAQMREGKADDALRTLRHFTGTKQCPAYFYYLEAEGWSLKGDWERAWSAWFAFDSAADRQAIEQIDRATSFRRK